MLVAESLWLYIRRVLARFYLMLPALLLDPFDLLNLFFGVHYTPPYSAAWAVFTLGLFVAGALAFHDVRKEESDVAGAINVLAGLRGSYLDDLVHWSDDLAVGMTEFENIGTWPDVMAKFIKAGVVRVDYRPGNPNSEPSTSRFTMTIRPITDQPHKVYLLTELGGRVVAKLEQDNRSSSHHRR